MDFVFFVAKSTAVFRVNYHTSGVCDILFGMRRCRINLPNRCCHLIRAPKLAAAEICLDGGWQAANRKCRAAMTRKNYCGNLLWQSSLTLLARIFAVGDPRFPPRLSCSDCEVKCKRQKCRESMAMRWSDAVASPSASSRWWSRFHIGAAVFCRANGCWAKCLTNENPKVEL